MIRQGGRGVLRLLQSGLGRESTLNASVEYNAQHCLRRDALTYSSSPEAHFRSSDLVVDEHPQPNTLPPLEDLRFGQQFADHMFLAEHVDGKGWGPPRILPFGAIPLHPAAQVLHYGMCCFEGMKAYSGEDGRGRLFRPQMNMQRLRRSANRLMLADFDPKELEECLKALLRIDRAWLPDKPGYSLYIRPFMFSSAFTLGVARPTRTTLGIICCPVGAYFSTGLRSISLHLNETHVRAWPGGSGDAKVGGNYAPTILPQVQALHRFGTPQVLYALPQGLDVEDAVVSESGAMNIFFFIDKANGKGRELITPPLDTTILPGVTRDSILALTREWGEFDVSERPLTVRELRTAWEEGRLREMFGCGTACIIQPVHGLQRDNGVEYKIDFDVDDPSTLSARLVKQLTDIQYARVPHEWSVPFE